MWQLDRALYHLACTCPSGGVVGIEAEIDDVEGTLSDGKRFVEQDKLSLSKVGQPFQDRGMGLWNTLEIWLEATSKSGERQRIDRLFLVTNRPVPRSALAWRMHDAQTPDQAMACVVELRSIAKKPASKMAKVMKSVTSYSDTALCDVIIRLELHDKQPMSTDETWRKDILHSLAVSELVDGELLVNALVGWLRDTVLSLWKAGRPAWISRTALLNRKDTLTADYSQTVLVARMREAVVVDPIRLQDERSSGRRLVQRVEEIRLHEEDIVRAVSDWLRYSEKVMVLAREGDVSGEEIDMFCDDLTSRWSRIRSRRQYSAGSGLVRRAFAKIGQKTRNIEQGREIYFATVDENYRPSLRGQTIEPPYFWCGAYHNLADEDQVGWHPSYKPQEDWKLED